MANLFDDIFAGENGIAKVLTDELGGVAGVLTFSTPGTYDPETDEQVAGDMDTISLYSSPLLQYGINEIDETNIKKDDCYILVSGYDVTETIVNQLVSYTQTSTGETFTIVSHKPIYSGDSIAEYKLQLRR